MQAIPSTLNFSGIYILRNTITGKHYIGQAKCIANRLREHLRKRNGKTSNPFSLLYRSARKHGWGAFEWSVLERVEDIQNIDEKEKFWIEKLRACDRSIGYNLHPDPKTTRGWIHRESSKRKMSKNRRSQFAETNPFFGKRHSDETKAIIGLANASWERTNDYRKKLCAARSRRARKRITQINPTTGEIVKTWGSSEEIVNTLGLPQSNISMVCNGKRKTCGGFNWQYAM